MSEIEAVSPTPAGTARGFPEHFATTRWSIVQAAGGSSTDAGRALEELCRTYWYPLYAYARRQGRQVSDAQDLTQGFVASLLQKGTIGRADPDRGRFRSFLLGSFNLFLADQHRYQSARKRGGDQTILSIDTVQAEQRYQLEPVDCVTAEDVFERRWALTVLAAAAERLETHYVQTGRKSLFEALRGHLGADQERIPHAQIAAELGMEEGAVKTAAHRLRKRYRSALRSEIAQTVASADDLDAELSDLLRILGDR